MVAVEIRGNQLACDKQLLWGGESKEKLRVEKVKEPWMNQEWRLIFGFLSDLWVQALL